MHRIITSQYPQNLHMCTATNFDPASLRIVIKYLVIVELLMLPLLIPRSQRRNVLLQQTLPHLTPNFQIREIDDSPTNPGDLVFPSLGIAGLLVPQPGNMDDMVLRAASILQRRRRCLILVSQKDMYDVQLR
jgi:hypothetical protein